MEGHEAEPAADLAHLDDPRLGEPPRERGVPIPVGRGHDHDRAMANLLAKQVGRSRSVGGQLVLVWMDLEMTGLDPATDVIVEIATVVTDDELDIVAEGPDLVIHQPDEALAAMDPVVNEMHTRSGLLDAIRTSDISLADAGAATLAFIRTHAPEPRSVPLCGNSIGTDRRFLAAYLPEIEDYLHYRSIDVSAVKELVPAVVPEARPGPPAEGRPAPGARRHPGVDRGAALLPRTGLRAARAGGGDRPPAPAGGES